MKTQLLNLLLLLIFSYFSCLLVLVSVSAKVFLSIDCGSSSLQPYTDERSVVWVGDNPYTRNGEIHQVNTAPPNTLPFDSSVMSTLRAFPTLQKKNCYSIDIDNKDEDNTAVERVLVRASFYYGDYDNKANPPTFLLQFNGNNWTQIQTSISRIRYKEVVYSLNNGNNINICLAQTQPDNIPFISALEVRSLDSEAYNYVGSTYPLFFTTRMSFAKTDIRFPEDSFDRIWLTSVPGLNRTNGLTVVTSNSPSIIVDINEKPPEAVLRTAHTHSNSSALTTLTYISFADPPYYPIHFNFYFSEVIKLSPTQKRSFDIIVNNNKLDSIIIPKGPVIPPYGRVLEVRIANVTSFTGNSSFSITSKPTNDSTLPPLVNAFEGYIIGHKLVQGTNSNDVKALGLLQKSFNQLQNWSGDPCLPSPYNWEWIACNDDTDSPRVTALYLNDLGLEGILPDFSAMGALKTIDLHNNSLMQEFPDFLGTFPKLEILNVADNKFSGTIPSSMSNNINLKLNVSGNPLCTNRTVCKTDTITRSPPSPSKGKSSKISSQPIIVLLITFFGLLM
ncbi:probable LRR receptor-like serine/threonine-protein kinase At1g05700 [Papaver somniferum]|uniref:probable LRR receptor-like serine/threonine-protein kinase At1g05700 n=1 Tax=Papaver somniferum TaxID=3469 RepID=UPI000E6F9C37|nr:probable LRR receptor-like serine/threonine-protein kinase At1g05700 [Papaver somniferum]